VFCNEAHSSSNCLSAQKMELSDKQKMLRKSGCCFSFLKPGYVAKNIKQNHILCFVGEGM